MLTVEPMFLPGFFRLFSKGEVVAWRYDPASEELKVGVALMWVESDVVKKRCHVAMMW